ncbi:MAG: hypothetical protein ACI9JK_000516 [Phycisphaerales bacterium]|jgi:hypothetical protein
MVHAKNPFSKNLHDKNIKNGYSRVFENGSLPQQHGVIGRLNQPKCTISCSNILLLFCVLP